MLSLFLFLAILGHLQYGSAEGYQPCRFKKISSKIFPLHPSIPKLFSNIYKPYRRPFQRDIQQMIFKPSNVVDPRLKTIYDIANKYVLPSLIKRFSDAFAVFATLGISLSLNIPQTLMNKLLRPDTLPGGRERHATTPIAENSSIRFKDVLGVDEAKAELQEVVAYLKVHVLI